MPRRANHMTKNKNRKGAMLVLIAITIILLLIAVAFSVDVAFMQLTRTELRTSTDAAARAATEALSREQSVVAAVQAARAAAAANPVAGEPLLLADEDIVFGHADVQANGVFDFRDNVQPFNSIQVFGRRTDDSPSGPVGLLFAGVLGPRTFVPTQTARTVNLDRDICLVVDRSGSMNRSVTSSSNPPGAPPACQGPHPTLSRWAVLDDAVTVFLAALNQTDLDELVGLVSYSSNNVICGQQLEAATIESPLADDYAAIQAAMQSYSDNFVGGATNIAAGIDEGVAVLTDASRTRLFAEKTMIVLTDGKENRPLGAASRRSEQAATEAVAANEITIHTITFSNQANQATMQSVANIGGGQHFHAPTAERLEEIFREIALTLPVVMAE